VPWENDLFPLEKAARDFERDGVEGRSFAEWWEEMHHAAKTAASGQAFKEAVERDHHLLARGEGNTIALYSAAGAFRATVDGSLTDHKWHEEQNFENFKSSIDRGKLPTETEAQQANDPARVQEFWDLCDKNAEDYKRAIEQAGYVLAQRDDKIVVVSRRAVIVDDLERLTPAITAKGDDISDYKKFIAPIAAQELPSVSAAQAVQDRQSGYDPEFEALMRGLYARQAREALDLSDRQEDEIHGDPTRWQTQRHVQESEEQKEQFAAERERYTSEYQESRRLLDEIHGREKDEGLERGEDLERGHGYSR
jgi:hypothetical protein